ncbi:MAG: helix-turn-helix transcriptional regulator [Oscillospiraceae bacterium]|nr:helix-turn-helix transcriptional regulator [Oscillospiraceae bacterium]
MKEINIAKVLVTKRKEMGITQDELANYIGVSKASVSKWETEQSYPDVTYLPQLAAYFNISIDQLMDYKPQMTKEEIRKLYRNLSADFTLKPFDEVMRNCRKIIKKY